MVTLMVVILLITSKGRFINKDKWIAQLDQDHIKFCWTVNKSMAHVQSNIASLYKSSPKNLNITIRSLLSINPYSTNQISVSKMPSADLSQL